MAKVKHEIFTVTENAGIYAASLVSNKLLSGYSNEGYIIVARYGVNKTTLKKLLERSK